MDAIFWRDELLQMMYWFRGEGLGDAVTPQDLLMFLDADEQLVRHHLDRLVRDGYAVCEEETQIRYKLTEMGVEEGGRRFADEFAEMTKPGHGACSNPKCACHSLGPDACEAHTIHDHG